jgi:hypothetical protein
MLLQNRAAFCDALITDMCRCARYKPSDVIGLAAAKLTYSGSHCRAGMGACFLMMTHDRLRRSLNRASNSAPTVTVRESGSSNAIMARMGCGVIVPTCCTLQRRILA